jgi:F-box/leucine-rich repeat protein 2/20
MLVPLSNDFSSCFNIQIISDIALAEIGDGCPKLKEIALSHCPEVTNVGLEHLVRGCLQLESCQMVYCRRISSSGVATIVSGCTRLKKLLVEEWKVSERTRRRAGPVLSFLCTGL